MDSERPRITEMSALSAENFKFRNTKFLEGSTHYDMNQYSVKEKVGHDIWATRNSDLRCVLDEFPRDVPLVEQCALWMHAVVGKHFFPDANHRTAIALLRKLLQENGIEPGKWPIERTKEARDESHRVRAEIEPIRLDTLYQRDELYEVWLKYFRDVLREELCESETE